MMEADVRRNNLLKEKVAVLEFKINKLGLYPSPILMNHIHMIAEN